jgi:hypothetical protein
MREERTADAGALTVLLSLVPGFVVGAAFGLGKIVRDCSLTCNVGYRYAPLAVLAVAVSTLPAADLRARLEGRLGFGRWQVVSVVAIALSFFAFRGGTALAVDQGPTAVRWTYLAFFVWLGVVGALLGPNVKAFVYRLHRTGRRSRALAWSAAAVMAGGLTGSFAASQIVPWVMAAFALRYEHARDSLMVGMGLVLLAWVPVAIWAARRGGATPASRRSEARPDLLTAFRWIAEDVKLRRMAALQLATGVAEALVVYLFYWIVTEQTSGESGRTVFFAGFYMWLHAGTLAVLVFGANRVVDRLGLLFALLSLPVALTLGTVVLLVHTVLLVMFVLRVIEAALEESFYELGVERVLLDVEGERAPAVRPILQAVMGRLGRGAGALLVLVLTLLLAVEMRVLIVVYLGVLVLWTLAAVALRRCLVVRS